MHFLTLILLAQAATPLGLTSSVNLNPAPRFSNTSASWTSPTLLTSSNPLQYKSGYAAAACLTVEVVPTSARYTYHDWTGDNDTSIGLFHIGATYGAANTAGCYQQNGSLYCSVFDASGTEHAISANTETAQVIATGRDRVSFCFNPGTGYLQAFVNGVSKASTTVGAFSFIHPTGLYAGVPGVLVSNATLSKFCMSGPTGVTGTDPTATIRLDCQENVAPSFIPPKLGAINPIKPVYTIAGVGGSVLAAGVDPNDARLLELLCAHLGIRWRCDNYATAGALVSAVQTQLSNNVVGGSYSLIIIDAGVADILAGTSATAIEGDATHGLTKLYEDAANVAAAVHMTLPPIAGLPACTGSNGPNCWSAAKQTQWDALDTWIRAQSASILFDVQNIGDGAVPPVCATANDAVCADLTTSTSADCCLDGFNVAPAGNWTLVQTLAAQILGYQYGP